MKIRSTVDTYLRTLYLVPGLKIFLPSLELPTFVCRNCGFWQRIHCKPASCPVCLDYRHILPPISWQFFNLNEALETYTMHWEELLPGLWHFWNDPVEGIGSHSYLMQHEDGNILFEGATVYSKSALAQITKLGGLRLASASHPHTYGALWQLQDHFDTEIAIHVGDLGWTNAFRVTHPVERNAELSKGIRLVYAGVHFPGQCLMSCDEHDLVFCGDAMKFDLAQDDVRTAVGISSHKSFVRSIPLTLDEILSYEHVFDQIKFSKVYSPFEQAHNVDSFKVKDYFKKLSEKFPYTNFISI